MASFNSITESLMAPDALFEVVETAMAGRPMRVFKNAPENMNMVFGRARSFADREFLVAKDQRMTFTKFFNAADGLCAWLQTETGIKPGQSVALCMKNCPEWMIAFVAIINAGAVAVLVNSKDEAKIMAKAVADTDCVFILADRKRHDALISGGCNLSTLMTGPDFERACGCTETAIFALPGTDEPVVMYFTSGTTSGKARAVVLSHRALVTGTMNTQMAMAAIFIDLARKYGVSQEQLQAQMPQPCSILAFPLFHTSGCSAVFLTALANGGKLVLLERWDADMVLELIQAEQVTSFSGVPTMFWDLLRSRRLKRVDLSSLMAVSCGGQALPLGLLAEVREHFPNVFIGAGYGMTEASGAIAQASGDAFLANTSASGRVLPMNDVRIVDRNGADLPLGEVGEIWVCGATLMQGYYANPEATAHVLSDGWYKTGDIGKLDEQDYITIVDRKTDMVISGGENIYCVEVEQVLGLHEQVREVITFGVPDARLGERLVAHAVITDTSCTPDTLIEYAIRELATYKVPTEIVVSTAPFVHNALGKVEKYKVRAAYLAAMRDRA